MPSTVLIPAGVNCTQALPQIWKEPAGTFSLAQKEWNVEKVHCSTKLEKNRGRIKSALEWLYGLLVVWRPETGERLLPSEVSVMALSLDYQGHVVVRVSTSTVSRMVGQNMVFSSNTLPISLANTLPISLANWRWHVFSLTTFQNFSPLFFSLFSLFSLSLFLSLSLSPSLQQYKPHCLLEMNHTHFMFICLTLGTQSPTTTYFSGQGTFIDMTVTPQKLLLCINEEKVKRKAWSHSVVLCLYALMITCPLVVKVLGCGMGC